MTPVDWKNIHTLLDLYYAVQTGPYCYREAFDAKEAPTFGGDPPADLTNVGSWDEEQLLVKDGDEYELIYRPEIQAEYDRRLASALARRNEPKAEQPETELFVLHADFDHEYGEVVGVFSTEELALEALELAVHAQPGYSRYNLSVQAFVLNLNPE